MPSALASAERATTQPSLFDSTTIGRLLRSGLNRRLAGGVEVVHIDEGNGVGHGLPQFGLVEYIGYDAKNF